MEISAVLKKHGEEAFAKRVQQLVALGMPLSDAVEYYASYLEPAYFINNYIYIYDANSRDWILFKLWPAQLDLLHKIENHSQIIALKARQVGLTWLSLSYILWEMIFRPPSSAVVISKTEDDAIYLISRERLRGMYERLPDYMKADNVVKDDARVFAISRGENMSVVRAVSTSRGDGFTGTTVVVDEADLTSNLDQIMKNVEPVASNGGKIILISKADRSQPNSYFKSFYVAVREGAVPDSACSFIAWYEHPNRDEAWYERQKARSLQTTGSLDEIAENYPATDAEALSPISYNKRFPIEWLEKVYTRSVNFHNPLGLPNLKVYQKPVANKEYCMGVDCSEGLHHSDYSVTTVVERQSGTIVAVMREKLTPKDHAKHSKVLSEYFNDAPALVERNNHGHAFIYEAVALGLPLLAGTDGRVGFHTNKHSKINLFNSGAQFIADNDVMITDNITYGELADINLDTLSASQGNHDDSAMAFMLALEARKLTLPGRGTDLIPLSVRDWYTDELEERNIW